MEIAVDGAAAGMSQVSRFIAQPLLRFGLRIVPIADDELRPSIAFPQELLLALRGQPVELGALVGLGLPPVGLDPAPLLEAVQRGVERAGLDLEATRPTASGWSAPMA